MTRVCGLDLSLTATGVAVLATAGGHIEPAVCTIHSTGKRGDTLLQRNARIRLIVDTVCHAVGPAHLVVLEGPAIMSTGGSNWDRAGLWWSVYEALLSIAPIIAVAPPAVVKKFAAGKGNADKAAVAAGITRLWPDVEPANDNEFDALALATIGAQRLDLPVPTRAHHADTLAKVAWPEDIASAIAKAEDDRRWIEEDVAFERRGDAAS